MGKTDCANQQGTTQTPTTILNKLRCFYTNADTLKNKFSEFQTRLKQFKPHIIGVNEVKPKNSRYKQKESEFKLKSIGDYNIIPLNLENDTGRGMLLYTHSHLEAKEVKLKTKFEENTFASIKLNQQDSLLIGLIYRSDSGSPDNNCHLRDLITEARNLAHSHLLLMGDFNYPDIDWRNWSTKGDSTESEEYLFLENLRDNYLHQHVDRPTRWRGSDTPNLLDLIITNEDGMIDEIEYASPLGKSDHCVLKFQFNCYTEIKERTKLVRYYDKADYDEISREIENTDWEALLKDDDTIHEMWTKYKERIKSVEDKYIPQKKIIKSMFKKFKVPLDDATYYKIRRKNALSRQCATSKNQERRCEYNKVRNQVKRDMRKMKEKFEKKLAMEAKDNPKAVYKYINEKSKTKHGITELHIDPKNDNSPTTDKDSVKAQILADFYSSVFTEEPKGPVPQLENMEVMHQMERLTVKEDEIKKSPVTAKSKQITRT